MNHRDVMQQALDALEWVNDNCPGEMPIVDAALFDLRVELAKPADPAPGSFAHRCSVAQQCVPESKFRDQLTALHDEMLAAIAKPVAVSDGWVAVPKEPTEAMLVAAVIAASQMQDAMGLTELNKKRRNIYKAMIETAPQPPAPAVSPVDVEAVREVIADLNYVDGALWSDEVHLFADQLARAIGDKPND